jgi:hypothetical protein
MSAYKALLTTSRAMIGNILLHVLMIMTTAIPNVLDLWTGQGSLLIHMIDLLTMTVVLRRAIMIVLPTPTFPPAESELVPMGNITWLRLLQLRTWPSLERRYINNRSLLIVGLLGRCCQRRGDSQGGIQGNSSKSRSKFQSGPVTFIFALDESGRFLGYAEMSSDVGSVQPMPWMKEHADPIGGAFQINHRTRYLPPHSHHLIFCSDDVRTTATTKARNFLTEGKPIRFGQDCQEISGKEAASLIDELERMSGPENAERRANAVVSRGGRRGGGHRGRGSSRGRGGGDDGYHSHSHEGFRGRGRGRGN